jgi:hypothetical protein
MFLNIRHTDFPVSTMSRSKMCSKVDHSTYTGGKDWRVLHNRQLNKFIPLDKPHITTLWKPSGVFNPGIIPRFPVP